ncbi:L-2-amino-thiazoline-4-carboxylic acid hydrolase [Capnocytophaga sp.]|uniref:L-2-amino-thiazoline-4-carboxylic acid hydrolase n=1 Tax=Capnocytophaga sp. TaxID=44737 RepID=UPI0026DC5B3A|nr:L-2-amino-thiazoline-4-carboxylic acid hydrolase [Capnocytophaga sp.]MDO5104665.1 L-2-amino-thiazoline-4-carboxylic acid hydrolase [Capnocytophaga sp.]
MANKNTHYQENSFSPWEVFQWIQNEAFRHIKNQNWLEESDFESFENIFKIRFSENLQKAKPLINNDLDKGNVSFAVLAVSLYEAFLQVGVPQKTAMLQTEKSINAPIYNFVVEGTEKILDSAENPLKNLVNISKNREKDYFGDSFSFERPIDSDFGYVLHIKKCLFHQTLQLLDRTDLQPLLCRMDLAWINGIKPEKHGVRFVRPVTFASGNCCQFWFMKEENPNFGK